MRSITFFAPAALVRVTTPVVNLRLFPVIKSSQSLIEKLSISAASANNYLLKIAGAFSTNNKY
jgi:hypothetical protein